MGEGKQGNRNTTLNPPRIIMLALSGACPFSNSRTPPPMCRIITIRSTPRSLGYYEPWAGFWALDSCCGRGRKGPKGARPPGPRALELCPSLLCTRGPWDETSVSHPPPKRPLNPGWWSGVRGDGGVGSGPPAGASVNCSRIRSIFCPAAGPAAGGMDGGGGSCRGSRASPSGVFMVFISTSHFAANPTTKGGGVMWGSFAGEPASHTAGPVGIERGCSTPPVQIHPCIEH